MKKVRKVTVKKNIDMSKYINPDTGELLSSELQNVSSIQVNEETGTFSIDSKDYVRIETDALNYMKRVLSNTDTARFTEMAALLKTALNVVYNTNYPHTLESLSAYLDMTKPEVTRMCNRLMLKGLLFSGNVIRNGKKEKLYIINPFAARKRNTFTDELKDLFPDFVTFHDKGLKE